LNHATKVTSQNFKAAVLNQSKPVVVDVWASWGGPCRMLAPHFGAASEEVKGKARFVKLDADKNQKIVRKYKVMGLPTLLFFKDGELVGRVSGVQTKNAILKQVKPLLSPEDQQEVKTGFNWRFWK